MLTPVSKRSKIRRAFTVIELLVVVGTIALVASAVVVSVSTSRRRASDTRRVEDVRQLRSALELYYSTNLRYPAALAELAPNYMPSVPRDPSGSPYHYSALGSDSVCGSYHLGATFNDASNPSLQSDVDQPASGSTCTGSAQDFSGQNVVACGGGVGADRCYDIVPEILAVAEMGGPAGGGEGGPAGGGQVAAAGESFRFSGGSGTPVFLSADIQPRDVKVGDRQTVTAEVEDGSGVAEMKTETALDHSVQIKFMQPTEGAQAGCTRCKWQVTWEVNDSSNRTYHTVITAKNSLGQTNSVTLAWTDPCSPGLSGDWTLDGNCTFTGVGGVENGNFTGAAYTMTISASTTFAFNSGYSFSPSGATIAISNTGQILKTELWIKDADADAYAPTATNQLAQDTQPTAFISRASASGTNDCYDGSSNAKPTQTSYFTTNRGDGSYDYNCDDASSKTYTGTGPSCPSTCCTTNSATSCTSSSYTANQPDNGNSVACGSTVTTYANTACGGSGCTTASVTQSCR